MSQSYFVAEGPQDFCSFRVPGRNNNAYHGNFGCSEEFVILHGEKTHQHTYI